MTNTELKFLSKPQDYTTAALTMRQQYAIKFGGELIVKHSFGWLIYKTIQECIDAFDDPTEVTFGYEKDLKRMIDHIQRN